MVPWLWVIHHSTVKQAYWFGLLFGAVLFFLTTYWVNGFLTQINPDAPFRNGLLSTGYWLYVAHIPALLAMCTRWLSLTRNINSCVSFPLLGTLLFFFTPTVFPIEFSTSQINFTIALQAINLTGSIGLHWLILLCNSLLYQWLISGNNRQRSTEYQGWLLMTCWFLYGYIQLNSSQSLDTRLRIGLVQPNYPPSIAVAKPEQGYSNEFSPELEISQLLARQGAEIIIWPELRHTGFYQLPAVKNSIQQFLENNDVALWIQDLKENDGKIYNVSLLLENSGIRSEYYKQLRIPFGETLPFSDVPMVGTFLINIFSGFHTPIATQPQHNAFWFKGISMQAFICYEVSNARFINAYLRKKQKRPALLIFQSNNSWFGNSIQPALHRATGILRSVEQGLPGIHVINNGPSTITSPHGEILFTSARDVRRGYLIDVAFTQQPSATFFSRYPHVFISFIMLMTLMYSMKYFRPAGYGSAPTPTDG